MRNFDDLFRDGLANHTEVPPARVWESLDKRLDARVVGSSKSWLWYAGVASVALLLGSVAIHEWRTSANDVVVAPATSAVTVAPTANDGDVVASENTPVAPVPPTHTTIGNSRKLTTPTDNDGAKMTREEKLTPLGNVQATGTSVHSYDDFDERAMASTQNMLKGDDAHKATDYKINKIQKHHLKAAEMVPVGGVPAPTTETTVVTSKPISMAGKTNVPGTARVVPTRRVVTEARQVETTTQATTALPVAASTGTVTATTDLPTTVTEPTTALPDAGNVPEVKTPAENTATSAPVASKPVLVPATRSRSVMQASAASYKPSTGGASIAGRDTMQRNDEQDANEGGKPKGLRGIFRRVLGN